MSNLYVGQKVVCIQTHSQGVVVKDCTYTVRGFRYCPKCGNEDLDVGVVSYSTEEECAPCGRVSARKDSIHWISSKLFRPLDSLTEQIERIETEGAPVELEPEYA